MKTAAFYTLGCKVNQYETEAMSEIFSKNGYKIADFNEVCDVYVINTCTVTSIGDRKSRQMIRRAKHLNPNSIVAVVGCYSQVSPGEVAKIEGVNIILGTKDRKNLCEIADKMLAEKENSKKVTDVENALKNREYEELEIKEYAEKTRAFVKIEDGCNEFCTYCIIPFARGPVRSRKIENIVKEVEFLAQKGFCEVVLTGIHLASYGKDLKNASLSDVICAVAGIPGINRIRLGSLEPRILTEEFIRKIADTKKVCNHFHISLQSGCDETLKRMNRKYTTAEYENSVKLLRRYFDNPAIATDIMVGFPGETDEEFEKSLAFMEKIAFADAHVFSYSNRKGTKADVMENQIDPKIKEVRHKAMEGTVARLKNEYLESMAGKNLSVLFEQEISDGVYEGTAENYAKVIMKSDVDISKKCKTVKIIKAENGFLTAE